VRLLSLNCTAMLEPGGDKPAPKSPCSPDAPSRENVCWPVDPKIHTGKADEECEKSRDCESGKLQFEQDLQRRSSGDGYNNEKGGSTLAVDPQIADSSDCNEGQHRRTTETGKIPEHYLYPGSNGI
jgi:hypothetical protein